MGAETGKGQADRLSARTRRLARSDQSRQVARTRDDWAGESAAIYCRISHVRDEDQTGVDRQERICRGIAKRLGLSVAFEHVFIDNNRSAWQRNRKRAGWDAMLELARQAGVRHIIAYHPDRLMRQPRDLEELLEISDTHNITLHGEANRRDLSDPDDRFILRIEVAHACRSSDDTSRRLKSAMVDRARDGKPNVGRRAYGYSPDYAKIIPREAKIIREVYRRYLDGQDAGNIAALLNERGVPTAMDRTWTVHSVRRLLTAPYVTGILVFRGEQIGDGEWRPIIKRGMWNEVQERRAYRSVVWQENTRQPRFYLLRGILMCGRCGVRMAGSANNHTAGYMCNRKTRTDAQKCARRVNADTIEEFVLDAAIDLLERLDATGQQTSAVLTLADNAAIDADHAELTELKEMWDARELSTREYRQMRKVVEDRIAKVQAKTVVRPTADVLKGVVGPNARASINAIRKAGDMERLNAILRFLFAAVIIHGATTKPGVFDYGRIEIEQNPL